MANHTINLKQELQSVETKRFEANMQTKFGRALTFEQVPLKEFVNVDSGLLETKVASIMLQGATDEAGYWRDIVQVYPMSKMIEVAPLTSMRNYAVRTGKVTKKSKEDAGGKVQSVKIDVTDESNDRYVYLSVEERDIEMYNWLSIELAIRDAGRAFAKQIRDDILTAYINDKGTQQALSTDTRFAAVMKLSSALNKAGYGVDALIIDSDDFANAITESIGTTGNMPWLNAMISGNQTADMARAGVGQLNGLVGYLSGRLPIYVVGNSAASLKGNILGIDLDSSEVLGLHKDITIRNSIDQLSDLSEAVMIARYKIVKANGPAIGYVSGV